MVREVQPAVNDCQSYFWVVTEAQSYCSPFFSWLLVAEQLSSYRQGSYSPLFPPSSRSIVAYILTLRISSCGVRLTDVCKKEDADLTGSARILWNLSY